jgi:D-threo-aldose 1-dehydrogenase
VQFSVAHPIVASLVTGFGSPTEVEQCMAWMEHPIPPQLWTDLKDASLIHADVPTP